MIGKSRLLRVVFIGLLALGTVGICAAPVDLAISPSDIAVSPQPPTDGGPLTLTITVHNNGTKASKPTQVSVKLAQGGTKIWTQKLALSAVEPGGTAEVTASLGTRPQGTYGLTAKVDPSNAIPESNEANNKASTSFTVVATTVADVGEAAAAAYWLTFGTANSVVSAQGVFNLPRSRAEDAQACTKSGGIDEVYTHDGLMRPLSITLDSPAPGTADCEDWISEYTTEPPTGTYNRYEGHMSADVTGYLSSNPIDPGFFLPASAVLKLGDGNPASDVLPDWKYWKLYDYESGGGVQTETDGIETWDMTANVTISGYGTLGYPTQVTMTANGTGQFYSPQLDRTSVWTLTNLVVQAAYSGTASDLSVALTFNGGTAVSFPSDSSLDYSVTYHALSMTMQMTSQQVSATIDGSMDISGTCADGTFTFATPEPVVYPLSGVCPTAGRIVVTSPVGDATLVFNADGSLSVDNGNDGTVDHTYASCLVAPESPCE